MSEEPRKTILVVDDEPDIVAIIKVVLTSAGYQVISADNGLDGVKAVYASQPDCIVLDVMMPRMNGYQACRLLKHDQRTKGIPVILCTVKSLEMDKIYGLTAGADHYLTKPFDPLELLKAVNNLLRNRPLRNAVPVLSAGEASSSDFILFEINELLDQKLKEYTILQHIGRAISETLNLDDLLKIILRCTTTDIGSAGGFLLLIKEDGTIEERVAMVEDRQRQPWHGSLQNFPGLRRILESNRPTTVKLSEARAVIPEDLRFALVGSEAAVVPVLAKGRALGVIFVEAAVVSSGFSEETLDFLMTLAGQAGLAIENAQLYAKTLHLSITDGLTELFNYRYFMERLEGEFQRARRYRRAFSFFILDIDFFKSYNDRFGHLQGDEALRALGEVLLSNTREVDVVARYGGEEFAVIMPETGIEEALAIAERIRRGVAGAAGRLGGLTVSIGVAEIDGSMEKAEDILRTADEALYEAKRAGRNVVCCHGRR